MQFKRSLIVLVLLAATLVAAAKPPRTRTQVKTWQLPGYTAVADTIPFADTVMLNYHDVDVQQLYSISSATNGNVLVSPIESRVVNDRLYTIDDPFAWSLTPYVVTPQQQRFFNTTTPFSTVAYKKGFVTGHEENDVDFLFTGNLNKAINLGLEMDYLHSAGHYSNTAGKLFRGSVWGSYNGPHYTLHAAFSWSQLNSFDNGGLRDPADLSSTLDPEDMPVNMNGMLGYRYLSGYLHNQYAITREREYHDSIATKDTTDVLTIRNTLAVTFCEAYNTKLKFGITAFAMNECQRFLHEDSVPYDGNYAYKWTNNTFVGGALHKHSGANVRYHVEGKVCVLGYKIGEFDVNGRLNTQFMAGKYPLSISARAYAKSVTPSWYLQHYQSNHLCWENDFGFTYRFLGGATVAYGYKWLKPRIDFSFENITKPIYTSVSDWKPRQYGGNVQIITGDVGLDLTTPWINLENRVVIQHSTNDSVMPVPTAILQHRLYYHGTWFKALDAQIGVDLRYFTRYHAPVLSPATSMFATQQDVKVGNYPWMNVYANFYVRSIHLRFFVQYQHINRLFMKKNIDYLTMPNYPTNRDVFRAGLAWHFYN